MRSIGDRLIATGHIPIPRLHHGKPSKTEEELRRRIEAARALPIEIPLRDGDPGDGWIRKSSLLAALADPPDASE